jgi:hypothetical protein
LSLGIRVYFENDQAQRHLQRRGKGHATLHAFINVVLRRLEFVLHEFQRRGFREILDWEDRLEHALQAGVAALISRHMHHQEALIRALLNLDQVRHRGDRGDAAKALAHALAGGERQRQSSIGHVISQMAKATLSIARGNGARKGRWTVSESDEFYGPMIPPGDRRAQVPKPLLSHRKPAMAGA